MALYRITSNKGPWTGIDLFRRNVGEDGVGKEQQLAKEEPTSSGH